MPAAAHAHCFFVGAHAWLRAQLGDARPRDEETGMAGAVRRSRRDKQQQRKRRLLATVVENSTNNNNTGDEEDALRHCSRTQQNQRQLQKKQTNGNNKKKSKKKVAPSPSFSSSSLPSPMVLGQRCDCLVEDRTSALSRALDATLAKVGLARCATQETFACTALQCAPILDVRCCRVTKTISNEHLACCVELKRSDAAQLVRRGHSPHLGPHFEAFADTWALRHHAQLALQWLALRERFPRARAADCYVGYVSKDLLGQPAVELRRLHPGVAKALRAMAEAGEGGKGEKGGQQ